MTTKTIVGELFHEIEIFGDKEYAHVGFRDKDNKFGDMIVSIVPEIGMKRKAKLTIELLNDIEDGAHE
ncbi:MAG: hypothetical protein ACXQTE_02610 [Methanosarcinaceae archaeon]